MTIEVDFEQTFEAKSNGVVAGASSVKMCTIPLATADWPLQTGRAVAIEADFFGFDSNGVAFRIVCKAVLKAGLAANLGALQATSGSNGCFVTPTESAVDYSPGYNPLGEINASGDLDIYWHNNNTSGSGITQDVAVRVKTRWIGS